MRNVSRYVRVHAEILRQNVFFYIRDINLSNSTFVYTIARHFLSRERAMKRVTQHRQQKREQISSNFLNNSDGVIHKCFCNRPAVGVVDLLMICEKRFSNIGLEIVNPI